MSYKKLNVKSELSLYRSISAVCLSRIRLSKRNETGAFECSETEADDKICNILSDFITKLLQESNYWHEEFQSIIYTTLFCM